MSLTFEQLLEQGISIYRRPDNKITMLILSSPGQGKNDLVYKIWRGVNELDPGYKFWYHKFNTRLPEDCIGLPEIVKGADGVSRTAHAYPAGFPSGNDRGLWFIDEVGQCSEAVQTVLAQIFLERRVGDHQIPKGVHIIAASNRSTDKSGARKLLEHCKNRVVIYTLRQSVHDWCSYAEKAGVNQLIIEFVRENPTALTDGWNPNAKEDENQCTPRSLFQLSDLLDITTDAALPDTLAGTIGFLWGGRFLEFLRQAKGKRFSDVLENPALLKEISPAVIAGWQEHLAVAMLSGDDRVWALADAMPADIVQRAVITARSRNAVKLSTNPKFIAWVQKNASRLKGERS